MIEKAKAAGGDRPVRVFGEMVSGAPGAALWNEVIAEQSVPLLCADALAGTKPDAALV